MFNLPRDGFDTDRFKPERQTMNQMPSQEGDQNDSKDQMISQVGEYDPSACPPDISKAQKHGIARRVGKIDMAAAKETEMEYCEDCGLPARNQLLPICGSRLDLSEMGPGFPLYYEYLLFCGVLLVLLFAIVGIYNIIMNIQGTQCELFSRATENACNGSFIILLSLGNRLFWDDFTVTNILNLVFVVVGILVSFYYRRIQGLTAEEVDRGAVTPADYTIIVKGLPATESLENIKKFFEEKGRPVKTCVKKIVCAYEIGSYVETARKKNKLMVRRGKEGPSQVLDAEIEELQKQMDTFEAAVQNNTSQKFTGIAFVTFETEKEAKDVQDKFKMTSFEKTIYSFFSCMLSWLGIKFEKTYNGKIIDVDRAPEPFDVFWENLGHDWWDVAQKRILTLLSSVILIALSFGMIIGVSFLQDVIQTQTQNSTMITVLSLVGSFLITIINTLIGFFMRKLAGFEKHTTYTYYFISIANKLSYVQFFNTALIVFIVGLVKGEDTSILWTPESIVSKVFFLFALNAIVPSLTYFADPLDLWRAIRRMKLESDGKNSKLTQKEANELYEGSPFDIAQRYANVQKTMLFTGFYATLIPIGIAISIGGLFLTYWTDKYMLLRKHCKPNALGKELSQEMADFLELFIVSFMCGNLAFEKITRGQISLLTIISLSLAVAAYILPQKFLSRCIQPGDDGVFNAKRYDDAKYFFLTEYDRVNPLTQEDAIREWFVEMAKMEESPNVQSVDGGDTTIAPEENKLGGLSFFQNLQNIPKEGTLNTLLNYAQNPSFKQVQQNPNVNYARHMPGQPMGNAPMYQLNPNLQQARLTNPQFNSFMNNFQQILGNKLGVNQQLYMGPGRPMLMQPGISPRPMVGSHIPPTSVNSSQSMQTKRQAANPLPPNIIMPNRQVVPASRAEGNILQVNPAPDRAVHQGFNNQPMMVSNARPQPRYFPIQQDVFQQQPSQQPHQMQQSGLNSSAMQANSSSTNSSNNQSRNRNGPSANGFGNMASQFDIGLKNLHKQFDAKYGFM